jgi:hypothetical protein
MPLIWVEDEEKPMMNDRSMRDRLALEAELMREQQARALRAGGQTTAWCPPGILKRKTADR